MLVFLCGVLFLLLFFLNMVFLKGFSLKNIVGVVLMIV